MSGLVSTGGTLGCATGGGTGSVSGGGSAAACATAAADIGAGASVGTSLSGGASGTTVGGGLGCMASAVAILADGVGAGARSGGGGDVTRAGGGLAGATVAGSAVGCMSCASDAAAAFCTGGVSRVNVTATGGGTGWLTRSSRKKPAPWIRTASARASGWTRPCASLGALLADTLSGRRMATLVPRATRLARTRRSQQRPSPA